MAGNYVIFLVLFCFIQGGVNMNFWNELFVIFISLKKVNGCFNFENFANATSSETFSNY